MKVPANVPHVPGWIDFSNLFLTLKGPSKPMLDAAQKAGAVTLNFGLFLIVGFAISWMVKAPNRVLMRKKADEGAPVLTKSKETLIEIRGLLAQRQRA